MRRDMMCPSWVAGDGEWDFGNFGVTRIQMGEMEEPTMCIHAHT